VGYVGDPANLDDLEAISAAVTKMGLTFLMAEPRDLATYELIDIGVAWCRRDTRNDATRSNIKLTNFLAHGIPSVVCDFESYREVDRVLGGGSSSIEGNLTEWMDALAELSQNEEARALMTSKADQVQRLYARSSIAERYLQAIGET
jgi:hypothetical protein